MCSFTANQEPCLLLPSQDGEELSANDNVEIVRHGARCSLTVVSPEGEDAGIYTCFSFSESGHASCQAQLTVEEGESAVFIMTQHYVFVIAPPNSGLVDPVVWFPFRPFGVSGERGGTRQTKEAVLRV